MRRVIVIGATGHVPMLVADAADCLGPPCVVVWKGRQHELFLDREVPLALVTPEGEEVAGQRGRLWRALHGPASMGELDAEPHDKQ